MNSVEKEAIKGRLLDLWLEDLRSERRPRMAPEMEQLTNEEIEEVMELARFHKAALFPTRLEQGALDGLASTVLSRLSQQRADEHRAVEEATAGAASFSMALQAAREQRGVGREALERSLGVMKGALGQLETAELPPHLFPIERMARLLQIVRLNSGRIVESIREASLTWAREKFAQPQMRLGRIDPDASAQEHRELLEGSSGGDAAELAEEVGRIDAYCDALAAKLPNPATAGRAG
jgi:transcriptional regulator with XRE-family HTH domain